MNWDIWGLFGSIQPLLCSPASSLSLPLSPSCPLPPTRRNLCSSCPSECLHSLNISPVPISQPFYFLLSRKCLSHTSQDNPVHPSVLSEILPSLATTSWWPSLGSQSTLCFFSLYLLSLALRIKQPVCMSVSPGRFKSVSRDCLTHGWIPSAS